MKHLVAYGSKPALDALRDAIRHHNLSGGEQIKIAETHARLIAAAPDLLAAMKNIKSWTESRSGQVEDDDAAFAAINADCRAAITKAKG